MASMIGSHKIRLRRRRWVYTLAFALLLAAVAGTARSLASRTVSPQFALVAESGADHLAGFADGADGTLWLSEETPSRIRSVAVDGTTHSYPLPGRWRGPARHIDPVSKRPVVAGGHPDPVVDASGAVWYLNPRAGTLGQIKNGKQIEFPLPIIAGDLALAANGVDLWVYGVQQVHPKNYTFAVEVGVLLRVSARGRVLMKSMLSRSPDDSVACANMALGFDGRVWLGCGDTMRAVSAAGALAVYRLREPARDCFSMNVQDLARSADRLWIVNADNNCSRRGTGFVAKISTAGKDTRFTKGLPPGGAPWSVALGPDRKTWFSGNGSKWVGRVTDAGSISIYPLPAFPELAGRKVGGVVHVVAGKRSLLAEIYLQDGHSVVYRMTLG